MAEGDFEKTVKLTPGGSPQGQADMDKTVKLTPQGQGPLKLNPSQSIPDPQMHSMPSIESLLPPVQETTHKAGMVKAIAAVVIIIGILGAAWYFVPGILMKSAAKLSAQGDHAKAAKQLLWVKSISPLNKVKVLAALAKEQRLSSDLAGAQSTLEQVLKINPNHSEAVREMGLTAKSQGRNAAAFEYLNRAYQANSNDSEALTLAAQMAFDMKDFKNAAPLYQSIVKGGGTAQDFYNLGVALKETGKTDDAVAAFQSCLDKGGSALGPLKILAKIYMEKGDFEDAFRRCEMEMQTAPNDTELPAMMAESALKVAAMAYGKKDYKKAAEFLERGLKAWATHASPVQISNEATAMHYEAAKACAKMKKNSQALGHLKSAFAADKTLKAQARKDAAFLGLRKNPQFMKIVR